MYGLEVKQVNRWLSKFGECFEAQNVERAVSMFAETGCWRDLLSFSWNIITVTGKEDIGKMFKVTCSRINAWGWKIEGDVIRNGEELSCWFTFETEVSLCKGKLTLIDGRCTVFFTSAMELKGYDERTFARRKPGYINSVVRDRKTWLDCKEDEEGRLGYSEQPYVVVVGGGQGGIGLAARLRMLGVPTIVIDKNNKPGDSWRNRYHSLYLAIQYSEDKVNDTDSAMNHLVYCSYLSQLSEHPTSSNEQLSLYHLDLHQLQQHTAAHYNPIVPLHPPYNQAMFYDL
jgi:putative flavoprotein involved in K+ transport